MGKADLMSTLAPVGIAAVLIKGEAVHSMSVIEARRIFIEKEKEEISNSPKYICLCGMK